MSIDKTNKPDLTFSDAFGYLTAEQCSKKPHMSHIDVRSWTILQITGYIPAISILSGALKVHIAVQHLMAEQPPFPKEYSRGLLVRGVAEILHLGLPFLVVVDIIVTIKRKIDDNNKQQEKDDNEKVIELQPFGEPLKA